MTPFSYDLTARLNAPQFPPEIWEHEILPFLADDFQTMARLSQVNRTGVGALAALALDQQTAELLSKPTMAPWSRQLELEDPEATRAQQRGWLAGRLTEEEKLLELPRRSLTFEQRAQRIMQGNLVLVSRRMEWGRRFSGPWPWKQDQQFEDEWPKAVLRAEQVLQAAAESGGTELLDLRMLRLTQVPREIGQLRRVVVLDLSCNHLSGLPEYLENWNQISHLILSCNRIRRCCLDRLERAVQIDLRYNALDALPTGIEHRRLQNCVVDVTENPCSRP